MTATVIKMSIQRMVCTGCGAEANASCNCGKAYVPKAVRAADAVAANPEKSNRAIAAEIGVSGETVRQARKQLPSHLAVDERTGLDGKTRRMPVRQVSAPSGGIDEAEVRRIDGPEDFWRRSLGNAAGDAVALRALWRRHGYDWERFDAPSDLIDIAKQAAAEWAAIVAAIEKP